VPVATRDLPSPIERFVATRPFYERLVAEGFLRKCIPSRWAVTVAGLVDLAILAEEFYTVDANVSLTMLSTVLGLAPLVVGGKPEQHQRFSAALSCGQGCTACRIRFDRTGGKRQRRISTRQEKASAPPRGGLATRGSSRAGSNGYLAATGWNGQGADLLTVVCRTDANVEPSRGISIIAVPRPDSGLIVEHAFDTLGHRAHLMPGFRLDAVPVPAGNLLGQEGRGLQLAAESFAGSAALVGIFGVALMRAAFQFALSFAKSDRRGGIQQIIQHQAVGYALADAKTTIGLRGR